MAAAGGWAIRSSVATPPPVHAAAPENTLTFPFNQRWAMSFWSAVFNPDTRFEPDASKSPEWNRGAYLAEALAHCGEFHTPRNLSLAQPNLQKFYGAMTPRNRALINTSHHTTPL